MIRQQGSASRISFDPARLTRVILGRNIQPRDAAAIHGWARLRKLPLSVCAEHDIQGDKLLPPFQL
jgi:hypothetical protein